MSSTESFQPSLELQKGGYLLIRKLENGEFLGVQRMLFTYALCVGVETEGPWTGIYRTRFCYESLFACSQVFQKWDGKGDPPGPWIKQKPEDRLNPNFK